MQSVALRSLCHLKLMDKLGPEKRHVPIEETSVFLKFEDIAHKLWGMVDDWPSYAKWTLGRQITEAADSIGFNLVEGDGRYSDSEAIQFFYIARGSAREAGLGIRRASRRGLLDAEVGQQLSESIEAATSELNGLIAYRKRTRNQHAVREERRRTYGAESLPPSLAIDGDSDSAAQNLNA